MHLQSLVARVYSSSCFSFRNGGACRSQTAGCAPSASTKIQVLNEASCVCVLYQSLSSRRLQTRLVVVHCAHSIVLTPNGPKAKRISICTKNASRSRRYHALYTNSLQPRRSHPTTSIVWTRHMRRPGNVTYRHGARQWFWDTCTSRIAYVRVQIRAACAQPTSAAAGAAAMQPSLAWLVRKLERAISPAHGRLTPASTREQSATASASSVHIVHCGQRGRRWSGGGEDCKHSPAGRADNFSMIVPVIARDRRAARAARRPAKHNTWSGESTGGRHQRGGARPAARSTCNRGR